MYFRMVLSTLLLVVIGCKTDTNNDNETNQIATNIGELSYTAPEAWEAQKPSSSMRKAQYRIPGTDDSGDAELAVFVFPGSGGTVEANLQRWYGQFKQPDGSASADQAKLQKLTVNKLSVTTVYLEGIYLKSKSQMMMGGEIEEIPDSALLAAIIETGGDPWFFKAVGPRATLDNNQDEFNQLVQSITLSR